MGLASTANPPTTTMTSSPKATPGVFFCLPGGHRLKSSDSRSFQQSQHVAHRAVEADEGRARDDVVADVQLDDLRNVRNRTDVPVGEAVAGQSTVARQRARRRRKNLSSRAFPHCRIRIS